MIDLLSKYNIEIIILLFSVFYLFTISKNKHLSFIWISAFFYSLLFEIINSRITGTYEYHIFAIGGYGLPLYIPMMRANLLTFTINKIKIDKKNTKKSLFYAFLGSLFVLSFDIAIDVIAIQKDLRTWHLTDVQSWFGVSYGNFLGWFVVAFLFIFSIHKIPKLKIQNYLFYGVFLPLVLQTIILTVPSMFGVCPSSDHPFSYLFLIVVILCFVGSFLFLYYTKNTRILNHGEKKGLFYKYDIATEIFFIIIHLYSFYYFVFQYYSLLLIIISILFLSINIGFLIYNIHIRGTKNNKS